MIKRGLAIVIKNWRAWILVILLVGPVLAYIGFGALWLLERHWLLIAGALWIASGILFAFLAARWTHSHRPVLPPIDWDAPATFSPEDREAWTLVEEEADKGDAINLQTLSEPDIYIEAARRMARALARHYHPNSTDPIDHVPVVELLSALELAAEDLTQLCRQVPGGDLITPSHWKKAVQAAGYFQKANEIYSYLLPIFSPVTGFVRLGTQQWMVKPAWRNMQQNLLRWFYRAYINRLGTHLIELYSGRLAIGVDQYRRLTRRSARDWRAAEEELATLKVAIAGARGSGKSRLIESLDRARTGDLSPVKARLESLGLEPEMANRLKTMQWVEVSGYTSRLEGENARDRATRRDAVRAASEADLLILAIDGRRDTHHADIAFVQAWDAWFIAHPDLEVPPVLVVVTGVDRPEFGGDWKPPYRWLHGQSSREEAVRSRIEGLRVALPAKFADIVAVGLADAAPFGVVEDLLPAIAALLHKAEHAALIRHLRNVSSRSKARRFVGQVTEQGRWLWGQLTSGRKERATSGKS